jgi:hypothetical protein
LTPRSDKDFSVASSRLPILPASKTAYRDLWHVIMAMPALIGCALLIILAQTVVEIMVPQGVWSTPFLGSVLGFLLDVMRSFLLTPIMIAAHRYIILGEVTPGYVLDPGAPAFQAFFRWLVALSALSAAATLVHALVLAASPWIVVTTAVFIIGTIVVIAVTARLSTLFSAIAVDAAGANASNAWADTQGYAFGIFLIFLVASLPLAAVAILELFALGPGLMERGSTLSVIDLIIGSPIQTGLAILYVAIASRLFQALAHRLNGEA